MTEVCSRFAEIVWERGVPVTRPERTIADLVRLAKTDLGDFVRFEPRGVMLTEQTAKSETS